MFTLSNIRTQCFNTCMRKTCVALVCFIVNVYALHTYTYCMAAKSVTVLFFLLLLLTSHKCLVQNQTTTTTTIHMQQQQQQPNTHIHLVSSRVENRESKPSIALRRKKKKQLKRKFEANHTQISGPKCVQSNSSKVNSFNKVFFSFVQEKCEETIKVTTQQNNSALCKLNFDFIFCS